MFDQAVVNDVESKLQPVGNAQLVKEVVQAILDRMFAKEKLLANFPVVIALHHQLNDLFFAVAQQRLVPPRAAVGVFGEGPHHFGRIGIVQPNFAVVDPLFRLRKHFR